MGRVAEGIVRMAASTTFLNTCRTQIEASTELSTFRTAYASFDTASHSDKARYWQAAFGDNQSGLSPAYRLRKFIRETVTGQAEISSLAPSDREPAIATLSSEYVPSVSPPLDNPAEAAALSDLLIQELLS